MKKILMTFLTLLLFSKAMGNNISWSFPPVTLSSATLASSDPQVAIDGNGNAAAAWVENGIIKSSVKPVGMGWSAATTLSTAVASSPRIVSDLNGNLTAVWLESGVVKAATKPFAGSWGASTTLSGTLASFPHIAVDSVGDVVAVWARNGKIESSTKLFGASWQGTVTINSTSATSPHVAMGGTGSNRTAVVVWSGVSGSTKTVFASTKSVAASSSWISSAGNWSPQIVISNTTHSAYATVAVDSNANAIAAWYCYDVDTTGTIFSNVKVASSYLPSGGSWDAPRTISEAGIRNPATLVARVAFDAIGNAIALWNTSFDDSTFNIESAVRPLRGTWTDPTEIVSSNLYALETDLAVSSLGDALAVYMFYNGDFMLIQSAESNFAGLENNAWSVPINLSSGANHGFPHVASTLTGSSINAVVVWVSTNGTVNTILATTGTRSVLLPPTSLAVTQSTSSFGGVFPEYHNTLTWAASTSPNIVGYIIFRNGTPLVEVAADVLEYVDDNRVAGQAVTYGVAAIDNQNSQSTIPTVHYP
ncbi:MAG TPA: hypothetical protein VHK67_05150 [Rhabdochlamydiaceae bacterium]|jgi:hypothetical protein|nr:hypothetical protein [Rhabdochlamydiaceae bacterium]